MANLITQLGLGVLHPANHPKKNQMQRFCTSAVQSAVKYVPDINAIKKLRSVSQAPIKDCKNALVASDGDFPTAMEWLRKKGISSASAKAGRSTMEGLIGVSVDGNKGGMVEVNSETDFVARNETFQNLVVQVSNSLQQVNAANADFDEHSILKVNVEDESLANRVPALIGVVGENVKPRRGVKVEVKDGKVVCYVHNAIKPTLGRAVALIGLEFESSRVSGDAMDHIQEFGKRLAMHAVAAKPLYLNKDNVPKDVFEKEKAYLMEEAATSGKPVKILEKIVAGRMQKFYEECTLMEQEHIVEESNPKIKAVLKDLSNKVGVPVQVTKYVRYQVGEQQDDL